MIQVSGTLATFLNSNTKFEMADLYTFTLLDGTVLRWTDYEQNIVAGGNTFSCSGPTIKRGRVRRAKGVEVSTLSVTLGVGDRGDAPVLNGQPLPLAAVRGAFSGATVVLERMYFDAAEAQVDKMPNFTGTVQPAPGITATEINLTIKGGKAKLAAKKMPWRVFQPPCPKALYSPACGVVKTEGTNQRTIAATSCDAAGAWVQVDIGAVLAPDRFLRGTITFTNGPLAGQSRSIKSRTGISGNVHRFDLYVPFGRDPRIGGVTQPNLIALFGCDKSLTACTQHANQDRFGGMPHVPKPESIR